MGIGNFFGMMPEKMQESRLYGVELDGITGRIAKQLYPNADIKITGFEKTDYPNDFFDVAIGNVPFGQYKVADKQYDKQNFLIHDYFLQRPWIRFAPAVWLPLLPVREQWIRKVRRSENTLSKEQNSGCSQTA